MEFAILVTITGLVVVFAALIALSGAIWIMGKLMSAITGNKSGKNDGEKAKATAVAAPANTNVAQATVNSGISGDVVAAISAAVARTTIVRSPLGFENISRGQEWCLLLPCKSFAVDTYQFITFYQKINRIGERDSRVYMLLNGRVVMEWRVVKRQAVMVFQQIR